MFLHTQIFTVFVNHVFFPTAQKTNVHLGTVHSQVGNAPNLKTTGIMAKHRAELALTKLNEVIQEKKSLRQITLAHRVVTKIQETSSIKYFNFGNKWARLFETP